MYIVEIDRTEGGNEDKEFTSVGSALRFAREELLWETTLYVSVTDEETGEVILNEKGSLA